MTDTVERRTAPETVDRVVVRFAGDSGDGMQLTGDRFTESSALFGNDLSTLPDFPAEIRAPAGTVNGVSSFQVHISDHDITTPGDAPSVLVAMNPAALMADLGRLEQGGLLIVNRDTFQERELAKVGYTTNPLEDGSLANYRVVEVPMTSLTIQAALPLGVKNRDAERSKNFFALGLISWLFSRPVDSTIEWIEKRFKDELVRAANTAAFHAGFHFGETTELFDHPYQVLPAAMPHGEYTNITGNTALAWGLVAAGQLAKLPLFLGSYPITPASDILHELSKHKHFGVRTVQAEDEIAAAGMALGAAFAGNLGITTTSGPGVALKSETMSLAVSLELPLILVDIQRGGPSTGLPTKTEAADLNIAIYGRHAEAPLPVIAAYSPSHCFHAAIEAARIALKYRTPVILLSDGYIANGSEPWKLPDVEALPDISVPFTDAHNHVARGRDLGVLAVPARPRDARPAVGDPRHAGADAPRRRAGEGGRPRRHRLHAGEPREDGPPARSQDRRHRERHPAGGGRRRRGRRRVHPRLGVHVGSHRRRGATHTPSRAEGGVGAPHAREPAAGEPRRAADVVPQGDRARAQPRPDVPHRPRRVPRRREGDHQGAGPAVHVRRDRSCDRGVAARRRECLHPWKRSCVMTDIVVPLTTKKDWTSDQEVRWCPGCGDYGILLAVQQLMPELGVKPENTVFVSGHRLLEPLPVLHEHVRHPQHPRPCTGDRDRDRGGAAGPRRVGDHRRR